jgi:hypothetical protein
LLHRFQSQAELAEQRSPDDARETRRNDPELSGKFRTAVSSGGLFLRGHVGATRRLLNFFSRASSAGKLGYAVLPFGSWMAIKRNERQAHLPGGMGSCELREANHAAGSGAAPGPAALSAHDCFGHVAGMTQLLNRLGGPLVDADKFREQQFQGINECPAWVA